MIPLNFRLLLPASPTLRQFSLSFDAFAVFFIRILAVTEFAGFVVVVADAAHPGTGCRAAFSGAGVGGGHCATLNRASVKSGCA
jgi:hypothetical protein